MTNVIDEKSHYFLSECFDVHFQLQCDEFSRKCVFLAPLITFILYKKAKDFCDKKRCIINTISNIDVNDNNDITNSNDNCKFYINSFIKWKISFPMFTETSDCDCFHITNFSGLIKNDKIRISEPNFYLC